MRGKIGTGVGVKEKSIWNKKDARLLHRGCILRAFNARKPGGNVFQSYGKHVHHASRRIVKQRCYNIVAMVLP